jgi:hypothetical protein
MSRFVRRLRKNVKLIAAYVSATIVIAVTLATTLAAVILEGYSKGWLLIPVVLFGGFGVAIRKMQW